MIILIRHAQSEGNKNREIHQTVPDHRVKLTAEGHKQAHEAGTRLRELLRPDDTLHFFTSPYRRTRETTEGLLNSLTSDSPAPSPFPRHTIKVYEEPRLREQDFGNFQPCSAEMERMWLERADYGHFFYRIPHGESAADAYDRVSGFNESLWRLFGENDSASVCVLVTHGLMTRVFLMKWYHWSVEYFEDLRNINHCEFVIMKLSPDNGKYRLQNNLRTWSELKRERELERQRKGIPSARPTTEHVPIRRRWGGCPDGCNHGVRRKTSVRTIRADNRHDQVHDHKAQPDNDPPQNEPATNPSEPNPPNPSSSNPPSNPPSSNPAPNTKKPRHSEDPPRALPNLALLHLGRDGGGSMSGMDSLAASEDEREEAGPIPPSKLPSKLNPRPAALSHQARPSQDLGNDGDDEGPGIGTKGSSHSAAGKDGKDGQGGRLRRARSYHHHHHHHHHYHHKNNNNNGKLNTTMRLGDILGDQDRDTDDTEPPSMPSVQQEASSQVPSQSPSPEEQKEQSLIQDQEQEQEQEQELDPGLEAEKQKDQSIRESVY